MLFEIHDLIESNAKNDAFGPKIKELHGAVHIRHPLKQEKENQTEYFRYVI